MSCHVAMLPMCHGNATLINATMSASSRRRRPISMSPLQHLRFTALVTLCALHFARGFCSLQTRRGCSLFARTSQNTRSRYLGGRQLSASKDSDDAAADDDENDDDDDDDDEEEDNIKPYGNRSLAWTKRYRRLNPYDKCRARVLRFGHRSKEDWDEAASSGQLGQCKLLQYKCQEGTLTLLRWLIVARILILQISHNLVIYIHVLMSDAMHNRTLRCRRTQQAG